MSAEKRTRQDAADHLQILYQELDALHANLARERDPDERVAMRKELAELRRCIEQEKRILEDLADRRTA